MLTLVLRQMHLKRRLRLQRAGLKLPSLRKAAGMDTPTRSRRASLAELLEKQASTGGEGMASASRDGGINQLAADPVNVEGSGDTKGNRRTSLHAIVGDDLVIPPTYAGPRLEWPVHADDFVMLLESFASGALLHPKYVSSVCRRMLVSAKKCSHLTHPSFWLCRTDLFWRC